MLSIALLGPVRISSPQHLDSPIRSSNAQALLFYLAVEHLQGDNSIRRESLMELLWPGSLPQSAQTNLRQALYQLRRAIPTVSNRQDETVPLAVSDRQNVGLHPEAVFALDVADFLQLTASSDPAQIARAVDLYRGDFLADFSLPSSGPFELWAEQWRENLRRTMLAALAALGRQALQQRNYSEAERFARRQIEIDDLQELGHHQLISALAGSLRVPEALCQYEDYCQLLENELKLEPSSELASLVEAIRGGDTGEQRLEIADGTVKAGRLAVSPALGSGARQAGDSPEIPHNLATQAIPIIGRRKELGDLHTMLAETQTRLITIVGPGGIGKTRLALAAAERQLSERNYRDGIYFVSLSGLSEHERIAPVIGETLQVRLDQGEKQLLASLRNKRLLLVLDNFEHLLEGTGLVLRILQSAPQVHIMTTSRERLHLQGEQVYPIQGFPLEGHGALLDARMMFLQAARRVRPDFQINDSNLSSLDRICRLVAGMPLALELAAAWVDILSPVDIANEIQSSLDILQTDLSDIPDRHRSMRAVFDTSWQNLSGRNQHILTQLSVFQGGFTREAAAAVTGASVRDLAQIIHKSLLIFDPIQNRYSLHELLRQYSAAKYSLTEVYDRHAAYYLDWLVRRGNEMISGHQEAITPLIDAEMDNIRAAVHQALRAHHFERFDQVIRFLGWFYVLLSRQQEGILFLSQVLTRLSAYPEAPKRVLFWTASWKMNMLGMINERAESWQLLPLCRGLLDDLTQSSDDVRLEQAFFTYSEGYQLYFRKPAQAQRLFQKSYELLLEIEDRWLVGYNLLGLSRAARNQWDLAAAEAATRESLVIFRDFNNWSGIGHAQRSMGHLASIVGRFEEAEAWLLDGIKVHQSLNQEFAILEDGGLDKLIMLYYFSGRFEDGLLITNELKSLCEKYDYTRGYNFSQVSLGQLYSHQGRYHEAYQVAETVLELAKPPDYEFLRFDAMQLLMQIDIALGKLEAAGIWIDAIDEFDNDIMFSSYRYITGAHLTRGILAAKLGDYPGAWKHFRAEIELGKKRKFPLHLANTVAGIALLKTRMNEIPAAIELYALAQQQSFVANSHWFADVIGVEIEQAAASLPLQVVQAAKERGKARDLGQTVDILLNNEIPEFNEKSGSPV